MTEHALARTVSLRQRIAARTPGLLRKCLRMAESYVHRHRMWGQLLGEVRGADQRSRAVLRRSLLAAPVTALAKLDSFQSPRLLDDVEVEIPGIGRLELRAGTDDALNVLTAREPKIRHLLEGDLPEGGIFVDAGANIGFYTLLASRRVGPRGRVFAFEMMPDTAQILRRHVAINAAANVAVFERALAERSGTVVTASVEPGKHGQASIVTAEGTAGRQVVEVETVTLDDALADVGGIDLMKMDLEGAEYRALCGAAAVLGRTRCLVFESISEDRRIFDLLEAAGFVLERLAGHDFLARRSAE